MKKTFYAVVTQYDCDPNKHPPTEEDGARGPLLLERYLNNDSALSEDATLEYAKGFEASSHNYGWVRVATVTVDVPDAASADTATTGENINVS